jgi:bacteriophage N4 adsorption protein B
VIFVGTYPNDAATAREVDLVEQGGSRVVRITLPHDGPTNKADCLNWLFQGIRRHEAEHEIEFQIFVMQDCEDVIHPLCYRLFNLLIPRKDMVQLPVHSLPRRWHEFTGAHYLDEFSQLHYKDLVVRELLDRSLPAAGVGVAFSRLALTTVAAGNRNEVFSTGSLTEDYDLGYRLRQLGMRQIFVKFRIGRDVVGVREYFPSTFRAAVRQKSRWVIGIAMQGWAHLGWSRDLSANYLLYRDRKVLVTNLAAILGYLVVLVVVAVWIAQWLWPGGVRFPPLVYRGSLLWDLLIANFVLLIWRVAQRAYCVGRLHGPAQAALSLPRMIWANFINFAATARAIRIYSRYLRTGKAIAWDKTSHSYPNFEELPVSRRRLGEVLLDRGLISSTQLSQALAQQRQEQIRLGEALVKLCAVSQEDLHAALEAA